MLFDIESVMAPLERAELEETVSEIDIQASVADIKAAGEGANHPVQQKALLIARDNVHIFTNPEDLFLIQYNFMNLVQIVCGMDIGASKASILNNPRTKAHDDFGNGFQTLLELATATVEDESVDEFVIDVKRTLYWALVVHAARDSLLASNTSKGTQTNLEDETEERNQMKNKNQVEKGGKINDRQDQEDMSNGARKRVRLN